MKVISISAGKQQGMLLGTYEPSATPWKIMAPLYDFGTISPSDLDRISID
ncbi:MAG: hypothetical protein Ct9H300mP28_18400 [Pseudomonadota bacterium]|nr:MAG: hypothetical protein Ct9H300mP28_18400 [Pseudomonadota bacterium]